MKRQLFWVALAIAVVFVSVVYAEGRGITVNIPYTFIVSGKQLPAGEYSIKPLDDSAKGLVIRSRTGKDTVEAVVITRISTGTESTSNPRVVFDKFDGNKYVLSEVFFQDEDGFLLTGANNTPHKHETIKAKTQ